MEEEESKDVNEASLGYLSGIGRKEWTLPRRASPTAVVAALHKGQADAAAAAAVRRIHSIARSLTIPNYRVNTYTGRGEEIAYDT